MKEPVLFVVPGELVSSKNSREPRLSRGKTGKTKIMNVKSALARADEARIVGLLNKNHDFRHSWHKEIVACVTAGGWPVRLRIQIYRKSHRRFDYVNIVQNLLDCLVKTKLLPDDDAKHVIPVFEPYLVDKTNPRAEITIEAVR